MAYFITGTDTDCGKTLVSAALLTAANGSTVGFKPIASGCEQTENGLRNSDALQLMQASSMKLPYDDVNPFAFAPAIAPHIAAKQVGVSLTAQKVKANLAIFDQLDADFCVIEGAGGWRLPLNDEQFLSEVVQAMKLPVILVVGMKLGCLNHALLTAQAIKADGLEIAGWVANQVDADMSCYDENLASLKQMMSAPCLGVIPHLDTPSADSAAAFLDFGLLAKR